MTRCWIIVALGLAVSGCGENGDGDSKAETGGATGNGGSVGNGGSSSGGGGSGNSSSGGTSSGGAGGTSSGGSAGSTGPIGTADFDTRCSAPGVVRCVGFDAASDIAGTFGDAQGSLSGDVAPEVDASEKASGASSLKFTIPSNSGSGSSGSWFTNFSDDLAVQFDGGQKFFVQWRQRFSPEFLDTQYDGGGGWKHVIIGAGDQPGCSAGAAITIGQGGNCTSSCTELETVVQNTFQRGFPQMYNSCSGSDSHGPYDPFEEPFGAYDIKLQNARPDPYCLYSQGDSGSYFPPQGNCFGYSPNEWMTFQVEITLGQRQGNEFKNSEIRLWMAREGQKSELVVDWGPYNLTAGDPEDNLRFGKVWLLPYHTGKDASQSHPVGYTWYDELIVSTSAIADPS